MDNLTTIISSVESRSSSPSFSVLSNLFKELRRTKVRRSDLVVRFGPELIKKSSDPDVWVILEQVCVAAFDLGNDDLAESCLLKLKQKFPDSVRVQRLYGLFLESQGQYADALTVYDQILEANPSNTLIIKRKIAMLKAQGDPQGSLSLLYTSLSVCPPDVQTWLEASELHLSLGELESAVHCLEECILLDPHSPHLHCRLAEAYYSSGGFDRLVLSRKHYALSLSLLAPKLNLRALLGLRSACLSLLNLSSPQDREKLEASTSTSPSESSLSSSLLSFAQDSLSSLSSAGTGSEESALSIVVRCLSV